MGEGGNQFPWREKPERTIKGEVNEIGDGKGDGRSEQEANVKSCGRHQRFDEIRYLSMRSRAQGAVQSSGFENEI
jgi:hypothetical protein